VVRCTSPKPHPHPHPHPHHCALRPAPCAPTRRGGRALGGEPLGPHVPAPPPRAPPALLPAPPRRDGPRPAHRAQRLRIAPRLLRGGRPPLAP
jgi:hypothetical protein